VQRAKLWLDQNVLPEVDDMVAQLEDDFMQYARQASHYSAGAIEYPADELIRQLEGGIVRLEVLENLKMYTHYMAALEALL